MKLRKSNLKLEIQSAKAINGDLLDVLNAQFINESSIFFCLCLFYNLRKK